MISVFIFIWVNTGRRLVSWVINSIYNNYLNNDESSRKILGLFYKDVEKAWTQEALKSIFKTVFQGYGQDALIKDLDSLWSPSFSTVFQMEKGVCTGAAGVNFFLAPAYARVLCAAGENIKDIYVFGIWLAGKIEGHAMCLIETERQLFLLDYGNMVVCKDMQAVKAYYRLQYEKGAGAVNDYFIVPFPAAKSYQFKKA